MSDKRYMDRTAYPSNLTDGQWQMIEGLLPPVKFGGRPRTTNLREVINGILYLLRTGCSWRMLPHDFPPWPTVHDYYRCFRCDGTWNKIYKIAHKRVHSKGDECGHSKTAIDNESVKRDEMAQTLVKTAEPVVAATAKSEIGDTDKYLINI